MRFYHFTYPNYATDFEYTKFNPITLTEDFKIPGVVCSVCGETWAGSRQTYFPLLGTNLNRFAQSSPLQEEEWRQFTEALKKDLNVPETFIIEPGDGFGIPGLELGSNTYPDIMFPMDGPVVVVSEKVVACLTESKLTGFEAIQLRLKWKSVRNNKQQELPRLYALKIVGSGWRVGSTVSTLTTCSNCQRLDFPNPDWLVVDENRWDGSDFFNVDYNTNMIIVTDKVVNTLKSGAFSNYICLAIPSQEIS